jgi:hypothetical protein
MPEISCCESLFLSVYAPWAGLPDLPIVPERFVQNRPKSRGLTKFSLKGLSTER